MYVIFISEPTFLRILDKTWYPIHSALLDYTFITRSIIDCWPKRSPLVCTKLKKIKFLEHNFLVRLSRNWCYDPRKHALKSTDLWPVIKWVRNTSDQRSFITRIKIFSKGRNRPIDVTKIYLADFKINICTVIHFKILIITDQKVSNKLKYCIGSLTFGWIFNS